MTALVGRSPRHHEGLSIQGDVVTHLSRDDRRDAADTSGLLDALDVAHGALPSFVLSFPPRHIQQINQPPTPRKGRLSDYRIIQLAPFLHEFKSPKTS